MPHDRQLEPALAWLPGKPRGIMVDVNQINQMDAIKPSAVERDAATHANKQASKCNVMARAAINGKSGAPGY